MTVLATATAVTEDSVELVRQPRRVAALLSPPRPRLLEELQSPDSAAGVARRLGLPRQQVAYHLRELERADLVRLVKERRRGNCVERLVQATARCYVISPEVLGRLGADPEEVRDRFSSSYLVAVAARTIRDLGELRARADAAGKRLATMTLSSDVCFASAADRNAFAKEVSDTVARLIVKYHDGDAVDGRRFRLLFGAYPRLRDQSEEAPEHEKGLQQ